MPEKQTLERARRDRRQGKSASTQAGEFVREEMHHIREGKHGARSSKQAIAIGLSKARRAGVPLRPPAKGKTSAKTRRSAASAFRKDSADNLSPDVVRKLARKLCVVRDARLHRIERFRDRLARQQKGEVAPPGALRRGKRLGRARGSAGVDASDKSDRSDESTAGSLVRFRDISSATAPALLPFSAARAFCRS
jgi:hypothetical protein